MKKDFISMEDISREEMEELFESADQMALGNYTRWAEGKDMAKLFYDLGFRYSLCNSSQKGC